MEEGEFDGHESLPPFHKSLVVDLFSQCSCRQPPESAANPQQDCNVTYRNACSWQFASSHTGTLIECCGHGFCHKSSSNLGRRLCKDLW
jgi:hypothetical protein